MVDKNQIVIFGAGKIGRSFIGQLFGCGGYQVTFIDINTKLINELNQKGSYRVVIKGEKEEVIIVPNIKAISSAEKEKVIEAVSEAGIMAVSVGKNVLGCIIPVIAEGLIQRNTCNPEIPLDIILAENMRSAADFVKKNLVDNLPSDFPIDSFVGLVETSIGKMVPITPQAELDKDPLVVFAEAYNTLIVDEKGFKCPIPQINGLAPKKNIKAWVDRKAFLHNLGHATAAYYGHALHPFATYMYEVLSDMEVLRFTKAVMLQSADILQKVYPAEFTIADLKDHISDLLNRFRNKALGDTIFRVGQDLPRKLGANDRFMGAIHLAQKYQMPYKLILEAMSYGLNFKAKDARGKNSPSDLNFLKSLDENFELTLIEMCGYDPKIDSAIFDKLKRLKGNSL